MFINSYFIAIFIVVFIFYKYRNYCYAIKKLYFDVAIFFYVNDNFISYNFYVINYFYNFYRDEMNIKIF